MAKKPSLGRQKIKMAKIEKKTHLQVTFSKRRSGLFKKASELCTLCGVEIAIIVFSPAGKVFCFGHPNVDSIVDRFLAHRRPVNYTDIPNFVEAHTTTRISELTCQLTQILNELESEKNHGEMLDLMRKASRNGQNWWESPIDEMGLNELVQLRDSMEELKKNVTNQANMLLVEASRETSSFWVGNGTGKPSTLVNFDPATPHSFGYSHGFF